MTEFSAARPTIDRNNLGYAILKLIREYGVETVFGIPGTHNLEFYRHLGRLGIHPVTARHEQGAGYAADAWAQRTGLPGVVITTSGPGLLNALASAGTAYCESRPMLVLSPGAPRGSEFSDIGTLHETKDQLRSAEGVFEIARRANSAEEALQTVHEAFELGSSGRPRPVYLEVPLDLLEAEVDSRVLQEVPRAPRDKDMPAREEILGAADLLASARRPIILAGGGATGARSELRQVAELLHAPVLTSMNGKGVLPESHPLSIGSELRLAGALELVAAADAVLVVGSKLGVAERAGMELVANGPVVRIDILDSQRDKNLQAAHALIGDSAVTLATLAEELHTRTLQAAPQATDEMRNLLAREAAEHDPVSAAVAARIISALPADVILGGDSSQIVYNGIGSRFRVEEPASLIYMGTYCTLGYALPAAIGAKIAEPSRTVGAVVGDGALMFSIQELQTAKEQGLDIFVICVDNGGYGEIKQNETDRDIAPVGVQLSQPDWPLVAEAFGGSGFAVTDPVDLEDTIREAVARKGVTLVHVPLDLFQP
ncbi:thiamine pyrophosphate-binding protein [Gulosibacter molinativorax]|uniref:Acetolactate synthase n=1 Tax=Gulosibacter molinativorax TaxID=256821 RepID=A0ABT7C4S7_9MICO|nr:thiamine pyrophosphate-dependent enzyme [Gulosibacter molinativorax]MDJ1370202.1 acetolactate synthase [Gulosibacter molinativorax]QUY61615.1 Acetolactate synthase [Gulosibacter molinativorax]